jgi:outer membrane protein assembly factor BamD
LSFVFRSIAAHGRVLIRAMTLASLLGGAMLLSACGSTDKDFYVERAVEPLYNEAMDSLGRRNFRDAARLFDEVERQHPYSIWATRAQIMAAYSHYQINEYDDAILAAQRFLQLHPGNKDAAYAYYLIGLSYYEQITDVGRDQRTTEDALKSLEELVRRFPDSAYARDARLKVDLTRDHLAGKEMAVGRYYLKRQEYVAAINRFRNVVEKYQTTNHVAEALHRLVECYLSLGVATEAQASAAVLGRNFPGSDWYQDSYKLLAGARLAPAEDKKSWVTRAFSNIF